jgi:D-tyrosyl-tRNA(Tyr) deacylase
MYLVGKKSGNRKNKKNKKVVDNSAKYAIINNVSSKQKQKREVNQWTRELATKWY